MEETSRNPTINQKLEKDIRALYQENQRHLQVPPLRQRMGVTKMRSFLFLLGLFVMLFLAFGAGFLSCYTFYPPQPETFTLSPLTHLSAGSLETQNHLLDPSKSYAARAARIRDSQGVSLLEKSQNQAEYQARQQARSAVSRALQDWSAKIRQIFGQYAGSAITPLTTGLAQSAADSFLTPQQSSKKMPRPYPLKKIDGKTSSSDPFVGTNTGTNSETGTGTETSIAIDTGIKTDTERSFYSHKPEDNSQSKTFSIMSSESKKFSLQIQEFPNSQQAWQLAQALEEKGLGAYVVRLEQNQRLSFAVRVGAFKNYKESREAAQLMTHQHQLPVRVVTIHPYEERLK